MSSRASVRSILDDLSVPTSWPGTRRATVWFALATSIAALLLLVPRPAGWTLRFLFAEDGQVFLTQTLQGGFSTLLQPYAGYLHVVPRLISNICAVGGPENYVVCTNAGSLLVKVLVATLAFPVLAAYARGWRWGLVAALSVLLLPTGQQEVLGNLTNLRWFLVFAAFLSVMGVFSTRGLAFFATGIALLASLSDPLTFAFAPIALWRILTLRSWTARLPALGLLLGVVVHILHVQPGARGERGDFGDLIAVPSQAIANLLVRGPLATQLGMTGTQDALRLLGVPLSMLILVGIGLLSFAAWRGRRAQLRTLTFAVALAGAGMLLLLVTLSFPASYIALSEIWSPSQPARYSTLAGLFLTPALVLLMSLAWRNRDSGALGTVATAAVAICLILGYVGDAGGDARHSSGPTWARTIEVARTQCLSGTLSTEVANVPVYEGWTTTLRCNWLG